MLLVDSVVCNQYIGRFISDELLLKIRFKTYIGKKLNLKNPTTFNEKLQWLKIHNRKPEYTDMVDKYKVRKYVAETIGEEYLIPLLGVWDKPEDIEFDSLPNQFVLKCNHNSGTGLCICKDKNTLDIDAVRKSLKKALKENYYYQNREWPYKNVKRKIIAEKYMADESGEDLKDYKFMCFNGKVECSFVCSERFSDDGLKVTFFDKDWNVMPFERKYAKSSVPILMPHNYHKMVELSEKLSAGCPFVRIDFYEINKKIYFGEITFFPGSGLERFDPEEWDFKFGQNIKL